MNEENDTGKHEFNFFLDKQIQEKLLEADELIAAKETALNNNQPTPPKVQVTLSSLNSSALLNPSVVSKASPLKSLKDPLRGNISGWCSGSGIVFRKTESDVPSRSRTQQGIRDALSRDSRFRPQTYNPQDFVFRHYSDPRKYIEQYRKEHTCYDTTTTSATRSEFLDTRRFYAYNQYSPLAVGAQNNTGGINTSLPSTYQEPAATIPDQTFFNQKKQQQQQQAPTLQYTNRRGEQSKQTISASLRPSNLYKLSKSNTTGLDKVKTPDNIQEERNGQGSRERSGSARGSGSPGVNGITLQRNSTTADLDRLSARSQKTPTIGAISESNSSGQFLGRKLGHVTSSQPRTLDALTSHAPIGGKQIPDGDTEQQTAMLESNCPSRQDCLPELPASARERPSSGPNSYSSSSRRSPRMHRAVKGQGHLVNGRASSSNLGPPLIPLDVTHQSGPLAQTATAKEGKNSGSGGKGSKKPGKKMVALAQTYAGPLDFVGDLVEPAGHQPGSRKVEKVGEECCGGSENSGESPSQSGSAVSIDQLSTTCLGAEVTVKPRPQLEASRTYHIFPTETVVKEAGLPGAPPVRLWSPGKSSTVTLNRLGGEGGANMRSSGKENLSTGASHLFDPGLGSPFRTSPRLTRPRTEEGRIRSTVEFITKDFAAGTRHMVNLCPDWNRGSGGGGGAISVSSSVGGGVNAGLKANTIQPDLPPTFQLKGVSTQPRLAAGGGAGAVTRRKRGMSKTATGGRRKKDGPEGAGLQLESIDRKSWSASTTDTTTSSGKGTNPSSQVRSSRNPAGLDANFSRHQAGGGVTPPSLGPVPYFKFWNSSIPPKSREGRQRAAGRRDKGLRGGVGGVGLNGGELNLSQMAQLMLAEEAGRPDRLLSHAANKVLEDQQRLEQALQQHQQQQQQAETAANAVAGQGSIASGISGDAQTAGSPATIWPRPEVRLEHSTRRGGGRGGWRGSAAGERVVVQPALTAPNLSLITEGDEGRSSLDPTSGKSRKGSKACRDRERERVGPDVPGGAGSEGLQKSEVTDVGACKVVPDSPACMGFQKSEMTNVGACKDVPDGDICSGPKRSEVNDAGTGSNGISGDGGGEGGDPGSYTSSLQPNDGSSVRTSLSSQNSSSNRSSDQTRGKKLKALVRPRSEDGAKRSLDTQKLPAGENSESCSKPAASVSSIPVILQKQEAAPSWRERVQKQQRNVESSAESAGDFLTPGSSRWAVARRQEELSSVAHARRIKQLIEHSRQRGPGVGLTLGRSVSEEAGRDPKLEKDFLRVEGQHNFRPSHSLAPSIQTLNPPSKPSNSEGTGETWTDVLPSPHRVLPPVRKSKSKGDNETSSKSEDNPKQAPERPPVLGDLLETQTFFSHGISPNSADSASKKHIINHHYHHQQAASLQNGLQPSSTQPRHASLSRSLGPPSAASRITLATAAVGGEPPQPRLKYTAAFHLKLTGSCLP